MTNTEHTPGPWVIEWVNKDDTSKPAPFIIDTEGNDVAFLGEDTGPTLVPYDNADADAHLIAAAPALFNLVIQYRSDLKHPPSDESRERRLEAIDAAITKATGGDDA